MAVCVAGPLNEGCIDVRRVVENSEVLGFYDSKLKTTVNKSKIGEVLLAGKLSQGPTERPGDQGLYNLFNITFRKSATVLS